MYSVGIDIGYSAFKGVLINEDLDILESSYVLHKGKIKEAIEDFIDALTEKYPEKIHFGGATGQSAKALVNSGGICGMNEVTALVEGSRITDGRARSIIEIGGQSSKYITGLREKASGLTISINSNCSAGTGSFLEEQVSRLGMKLEDYAPMAEKATEIPRIAGRCSVFAKTDIIHHQQEGQSVNNILRGLAYALVKNYRANVIKKHPVQKPILVAGGVRKNQTILEALKSVLKLESDDMILPEHSGIISAIGVASLGLKEKAHLDLKILRLATAKIHREEQAADGIKFSPLGSYGKADSKNKHLSHFSDRNQPLTGFLGMDIGSTSTNVIFMDEQRRVISHQYLRTKGDPIAAVNQGIELIKEEACGSLRIRGAGATGSGRHLAGKHVGADTIVDEITAQAKAAHSIDPEVDTIIEIGGQDSKFIKMDKGAVVDFEMNKICAAGTGSFIEEQAKKLDIPIEAFGDLALSAESPVDLGDRCTVFIESNIAGALSRGEEMADIAAGLSYSIANNYLNKVVGRKTMGKKIFFQGGVAYNQAVVNAFRSILGKTVEVPPFFSVTGAYGAAILAQERMGRAFATEESNSMHPKQQGVFQEVERHYLEGYNPERNPRQKTVGIPRVLFLHKLFPLFNTYFKELGLNVVLSDKSDEKTVERSQEHSIEETCYPVKLINGHVAELMEKNVDYLFLPSLHTMAHPVSQTRQNYGCVYMQCAPKLVEKMMEPEKKGITLLTPELSFNFGKQHMMKVLMELGEKLGKNKIQTSAALAKGMMHFKAFEKKVEELGEKTVRELKDQEKVFVIVTRAYGITDPVLNMGIPEKLEAMGHKVLTLSNLPAHDYDTSGEYPNMYWPFGQHILSGIRIIKEHPNLYPIYLTNHGCGPDTTLVHLVKSEMGEKPYLHLEVDEHCSAVGVITRLEAFINALKSEKTEPEKALSLKEYGANQEKASLNMKMSFGELDKETEWYIPYMDSYSLLLAKFLQQKGYHIKVLPKTSKRTLDIGRKKTLTKEYLSFTALLGDVLAKARETDGENRQIGFVIPTTEGAEAGGQYHQLIREKLNSEGFADLKVLAPFVEDLIKEKSITNDLFLLMLAGDMVHLAPENRKREYENTFLHLIRNESLNMDKLENVAAEIRDLHQKDHSRKILRLVGETGILFNPLLNNDLSKVVEKKGIRLRYQPLSESFWFLWKDFLAQGINKNQHSAHQELKKLEAYIKRIHLALEEESPFEEQPEALLKRANSSLKYYAGGNGRYRIAKATGGVGDDMGMLMIASMYENTDTILTILQEEELLKNNTPHLQMTFDGDENETDKSKLESFIYYRLKEQEKEEQKKQKEDERKGA
ncbi:CoA-substrate-specific enzyme activase, putative [Tindallia magadiensis]|uniref:CoA-substrate-specific enzyme activase, putative n=1 Tax=Tindallia magadiensis TaxID=69895 RepID=A0A1I3FEX6_9FIRM|nr:acyl-CoA dehydratase activase [Tindallia magadiensis]SFI09746.1 CoA-substrate-specific enzyme activase, putative [Tindallia magadiensis]